MNHIAETCKLCNHSKFHNKYTIREFSIIECCHCGFVQVSDIDKHEKYEYNDDYFRNNKYKDKTSLNRENKRRGKLLKKYCNLGSKVIDVGCAAGEFVFYVKNDFDIYGCDFSESAIKLAKIRNIEMENKFWVGSAENIKSENMKYDAICLWDVIEHVYDPKLVISQLMELLDDEGCIIISTPNIGAFFSKLMKKKWPFMTPPEHVGFFSHKSMKFLAKKCNYKIVYWSSKGKWANLGFILYKINRVKPGLIPERFIEFFKSGFLSKINIYVPTKDIQYVVIVKN